MTQLARPGRGSTASLKTTPQMTSSVAKERRKEATTVVVAPAEIVPLSNAEKTANIIADYDGEQVLDDGKRADQRDKNDAKQQLPIFCETGKEEKIIAPCVRNAYMDQVDVNNCAKRNLAAEMTPSPLKSHELPS